MEKIKFLKEDYEEIFFKVRLFFSVFCLPLIVFANPKTDNECFLFVYRKHL